MAERIAVPTDVTALKLLCRVDYEDAFRANTTACHSPVEWARLALEEAPPALLGLIRPILAALGLRPATRQGPSSSDHILGWRILQCDEAHAVLGVDARFGAPRIIFSAPPGYVVMTTQLRFDQFGFSTVWARVGGIHRRVARYLVDRAASAPSPSRSTAWP